MTLLPARKPGVALPQGFGPGGGGPAGPPPALLGYYAMEARNFANGQRSIYEIRQALTAEFGPIALEAVTQFFRDGEKAGAYVIAVR